MRIVFALLLVATLTGCGAMSRLTARYKGYDIQCVNGVNYIQFTSGASVAYNQDGKISTCAKEN